jgi:hypothetical protein
MSRRGKSVVNNANPNGHLFSVLMERATVDTPNAVFCKRVAHFTLKAVPGDLCSMNAILQSYR